MTNYANSSIGFPYRITSGSDGALWFTNRNNSIGRITTPNNIQTPTVTSISPTSGPTAGGSTVTITGTGFTGATKVVFGLVAATCFTVAATTITAVSPAETASSHNVFVITSGGNQPGGGG